jgi:hypothetical protein
VGQAARDAYERMRPQTRPMMRDGTADAVVHKA